MRRNDGGASRAGGEFSDFSLQSLNHSQPERRADFADAVSAVVAQFAAREAREGFEFVGAQDAELAQRLDDCDGAGALLPVAVFELQGHAEPARGGREVSTSGGVFFAPRSALCGRIEKDFKLRRVIGRE